MAKSKKRRESFTRLNIHERTIIEVRYCTDKKSIRSIAQEIGRSHTTVLREINGKPRRGAGKYRALSAQQRAMTRIQSCGRRVKMHHKPLKEYVIEKLEIGWSPEQIALRLPQSHTDMRISHETIYAYIYRQINPCGTVKQGGEDLRDLLPRRRKRRMQKGMRKAQKLERDSHLPSIEDMPKEVEERTVIGHWQGDTVVSRKSVSRVKSINEVTSGVVFFEKTEDGTATTCNDAIIRRLKEVPPQYRKTLLQDRGKENMCWEDVEQETGISCYFAHPYCSYERGANENANGLLRRLFPKGTDFGKVSAEDIARVEYLINTRPRKRLGGLTPYEVFYQKTGVDLESMAYSKLTSGAIES